MELLNYPYPEIIPNLIFQRKNMNNENNEKVWKWWQYKVVKKKEVTSLSDSLDLYQD